MNNSIILNSEKEYTRDSNQFVVPPSGGSFKVPGHINKRTA